MNNEHGISVRTLPKVSYSHEACVFEICFPHFENLPSGKGVLVESPEFTCFGHQWKLQLYPGGEVGSKNRSGMVSVFLQHTSIGELKVDLEVRLGSNGARSWDELKFNANHNAWGWSNFFLRTEIIDRLHDEALVLQVRLVQTDTMEQDQNFIPPNPVFGAICKSLNNDKSSDVLFLVGGQELKNGGTKKAKADPTQFHAHRVILNEGAPFLSDLCDQYEKNKPVFITDVKPDIFRCLLQYVYGHNIPHEELKEKAKDIIDASDKYGVIGLKIEAESCFVKSTTITVDNVIDNLLYAQAKNCALLNEAVMDFIYDNEEEVLENVCFDDVPGGVFSDLLVSVARAKKRNKSTEGDDKHFNSMRVNELRKLCHEKGLEIDGSRKTMILLLKNAQERSE